MAHLDTAHWLVNNAAVLDREIALRDRRGVALDSHKFIGINRAIETADYATLLGNDYDFETYAFAGKPVFEVPNPAAVLYPWSEDKDFAAARTRFLWIGSHGLVHKGLDLVLEAFARMPEVHLTVCGPIGEEPAFEAAFRRELYGTPNIETLGWVDIASPAFAALLQRTVALVYPSCAEACCGTVVNSMQAGLIPLASRESGVDIDEGFGMLLGDGTVEAVEAAVRQHRGPAAGRARGDVAPGLDGRPRHATPARTTARCSAPRSSASSPSTPTRASPASCACPAKSAANPAAARCCARSDTGGRTAGLSRGRFPGIQAPVRKPPGGADAGARARRPVGHRHGPPRRRGALGECRARPRRAGAARLRGAARPPRHHRGPAGGARALPAPGREPAAGRERRLRRRRLARARSRPPRGSRSRPAPATMPGFDPAAYRAGFAMLIERLRPALAKAAAR